MGDKLPLAYADSEGPPSVIVGKRFCDRKERGKYSFRSQLITPMKVCAQRNPGERAVFHRRLKIALLLLSATLAIGIVSPGEARGPRAPVNWETDLRKANDQEVAAFMAGDTGALSRLWADDFLVTNPLNKVATKADVLSMVHDGMLSFKSYQRNIEHIRRYGDTAVIIGNENVEWAGKMPLAGHALPLRFTAIWLHSGKHWLQVARHANVVPKM